MNVPLTGQEPGLVGYWRLNEALLSQNVLDSSTSGNDGFLGSSASPGPDNPERVVSTVPLKQLIPIITWTSAAPITYGTALSSNQLNATASVSGTFTYSPTIGTVLNAGSNALSVIFTPTDTADYTSVTDTVYLVVSQAPLTVTATNTSRAYGQPNPPFTGTITGVVNGDDITATYNCRPRRERSPGTYPIVPSLLDPYGRLTNYQVTLINGTLTVTNATVARPPSALGGHASSKPGRVGGSMCPLSSPIREWASRAALGWTRSISRPRTSFAPTRTGCSATSF